MTTIAVLASVAVVVFCVREVMNWAAERIHAEMVAGVHAVLRSRTPDGSGQTGSAALPQVALSDRVGVELSRTDAPPTPSNLVGAAVNPRHAAPTRVRILVSHLISAGAADHPTAAPTGPHRFLSP